MKRSTRLTTIGTALILLVSTACQSPLKASEPCPRAAYYDEDDATKVQPKYLAAFQKGFTLDADGRLTPEAEYVRRRLVSLEKFCHAVNAR